jgi:non-ribosomal peptide synthetase component F
VLTYEDVPAPSQPRELVRRPQPRGGPGGRTALIGPDGATTYAELAALVNRSGHVLRELGVRAEERVLLVLSDGLEFVALWYGAQKIGAVTAEAYTFLQPKDYAYYLDYTRAGVVVVDGSTLGAVRDAAQSSRWLRRILLVGAARTRESEASFEALVADAPDELEPAPTTRDDIALWKFTTGSTGAPKAAVHPQHTPLLSFDWYARGRPRDPRGRRRPARAEALLRLRARPDGALSVRGRRAGIVFPERTTPERIFELVARHRPSILVQVPTMMAAMTAHPTRRARISPACGSAPRPARRCPRALRALAGGLRRRGARRHRLLRGLPHLHLQQAGRVRPAAWGRSCPATAPGRGEDGREVPDGETGPLGRGRHGCPPLLERA